MRQGGRGHGEKKVGSGLGRFPGLLDEGMNAGQEFFEVLLHLLVFFEIAAKGITDIATAQTIIRRELAQEIDFFFRLRIFRKQGRQVRAPERKDVRGFFDQVDGDGPAFVTAEVEALGLGQCDAMPAGVLSGKGTDTRAADLVVLGVFDEVTKKHLSQGAAAGVSSADKKDVFQRTPRVPRWSGLSKGRSLQPRWKLRKSVIGLVVFFSDEFAGEDACVLGIADRELEVADSGIASRKGQGAEGARTGVARIRADKVDCLATAEQDARERIKRGFDLIKIPCTSWQSDFMFAA